MRGLKTKSFWSSIERVLELLLYLGIVAAESEWSETFSEHSMANELSLRAREARQRSKVKLWRLGSLERDGVRAGGSWRRLS
jgi:hypothetical protein